MTDAVTTAREQLNALGEMPEVTRPLYVLRLETADGIGPLGLTGEIGARIGATLQETWHASDGAHPNLYHPRGHSSWGRSEWWQREGITVSEWQCAIELPIHSWRGFDERDAQALARHLTHWFTDDADLHAHLAECDFGLTVLALPDWDRVEHGYHGQRIYHEPSATRAARIEIDPSAAGSSLWLQAAARALDTLALEIREHAERCNQAIIDYRRDRRNAQARLRRALASQQRIAA
jgi:hypothetical protein